MDENNKPVNRRHPFDDDETEFEYVFLDDNEEDDGIHSPGEKKQQTEITAIPFFILELMQKRNSFLEDCNIAMSIPSENHSALSEQKQRKANYYALEAAYLCSLWMDEDIPENIRQSYNTAFLRRRGETDTYDNLSIADTANLLKEGAQKRDTFSLINLALLWCIPSDYTEWTFAMNLIDLIDPKKVGNAAEWWGHLAESGDAEGHTVLMLLKANKLINNNLFGSTDSHLRACCDGGFDPPKKRHKVFGAVFALTKGIENDSNIIS